MAGILGRLFLSFFKIGFFAFGGGYAAISIIQEEVVQLNTWLSSQEFLDVLAIAQITPGPIALNSATYIGYKLIGFPGALVATIGVVTPPSLIIMTLIIISQLFRKGKNVSLVLGALQSSVTVLIILAALTIGKELLSQVNVADIAVLAVGLILLNLKKKLKVYLVILLSGAGGILFQLLYHTLIPK
ncbi:MAG: chromate transporter [Spirochaetota bacterium]